MRIAIISDIHGNLPALEAVLADIRHSGAEQIICLGDVANLGPHPLQCLDLVRETCAIVIQGNHERYLLGDVPADDWETCPTFAGMRWIQRQLRPQHFTYMEQLPLRHEVDEDGAAAGVLVHASPLSQFDGFYSYSTDVEVTRCMAGVDGVMLFCGHTHISLYRRWSASWLVNVGAVGMPLDGTPEAKYAIATLCKGQWRVEFRHVGYDRQYLMAEFERTGLQAEGGVVAAVFRYEMFTGKPLAAAYLSALQQHATRRGVRIGDIYDAHPVPPQVQGWLNV